MLRSTSLKIIKIQTYTGRCISSKICSSEYNEAIKSGDNIPGPISIPIFKQLHHFLPGGQLYNINGLDLWKKLYEDYGPIVKLDTFLKRTTIFIFDPGCAEKVIRSENVTPYRNSLETLAYFRKTLRAGTYKYSSLAAEQGETWRKMRSLVNPIMLHPRNVALYTNAISEISDEMVSRIKYLRDHDPNRIHEHFHEELSLWALETTGVIALGERLKCFDLHETSSTPGHKVVELMQQFFHLALELEIKPNFWKYFPTTNFRRAMATYAEMEKLSEMFIAKAMKKINTKESQCDQEKSILEKLIELDEALALVMATDMLYAGIDTTSNAMNALLYLIASHPEKQEILRAEIRTQSQHRPYLKACIKESFRMLPVAGVSGRVTTKEYDLLGYKIPKDTRLVFCHQLMSMMENNFPRPKEFLPERWLTHKEDPIYHGNAHSFSYNPFGFGVRNCIGRRIAELELETFVTRMVDSFKLEWCGPPLKIDTAFLNFVRSPFYYKFHNA